jgi:hypothetical protein
MQISLINFTDKPDAEVLDVVRAINRQLTEDFTPIWAWSALLRLEGAGRKPDASIHNLKQAPQDLRGDAIIYLWDKPADVDDALGYHDANNRGLPYGFVFTKLSEQLKEAWSTTLSHEVLELVGDAHANTFAAGPHPKDPERLVFHWYEMCDAVQAESYDLDGVKVSNFVLPQYFTVGEQTGARNDFLNLKPHGKPLPSFGINPGGYVGFFDPQTGEHSTVTADRAAEERLAAKSRLGNARVRRSLMYKDLTPTKPSARLQARPPARHTL